MSDFDFAKGNTIVITAASAMSAGDVQVIGDRIAVAIAAIANGFEGSALVDGVVELPALNTEAFSQGDQLYWDAGNTLLTKTASTHKKAGFAFDDKASAGTVCRIKINA